MATYKGRSGAAYMPTSSGGISSGGIDEYDAPEVEGVDPNDPEGNVPEELIPKGLNVKIKRWANFPDKPPRKDRLTVGFEFEGGGVDWVFDELIYPVPPTELIIKIPPDRLTKSGVAYVHYVVWLEDVNDIKSFRRKLTIDASPADIAAPEFRGVDIWGQLHCKSVPKLWEGVLVWIKPDPGFMLGDYLVIAWEGYDNEVVEPPPIAGTQLVVRKKIETQSDLDLGVEVWIRPYDPYIKPMEKNASARARCFLERNGRVIRKSAFGKVKISRMEAGQDKPCEPLK